MQSQHIADLIRTISSILHPFENGCYNIHVRGWRCAGDKDLVGDEDESGDVNESGSEDEWGDEDQSGGEDESGE